MRGMKPIAMTLFCHFFPSQHGISRLTQPNSCDKPRIRAFPGAAASTSGSAGTLSGGLSPLYLPTIYLPTTGKTLRSYRT
jgi:hypothetical protein